MPTKPLRLFIRPPYTDWQLVRSYGAASQDGQGDPAVLQSHVLLLTTGKGLLHAAVDGKLSVRPPGRGAPHPAERLASPLIPAVWPQTVNLYLHPSPLVFRQRDFRRHAQEISSQQDFILTSFAYLKIETASLPTFLADALIRAAIRPNDVSQEQLMGFFLAGLIDIPVSVGRVVGLASSLGTASAVRQVGFTVLTNAGPIEPSFFYDWMRDFVEDGSDNVDAFLQLAPKRWPLFDTQLGIEEVIALTEHTLYPMATLVELKARYQLSAGQWRRIGDHQKRLWINRLLKHTGHAPADSQASPFEFTDEEWRNIFQLEAIVEFYANFDDPWQPGAVPRHKYGPLAGSAAQVVVGSGNEVLLDGNPDLSGVRPSSDQDTPSARHTLWLKDDQARVGRRYSITAVFTDRHAVAIDGAPSLPGPSSWRIDFGCFDLLNPAGEAAGLVEGKSDVVKLDGDCDLTRVQINTVIGRDNSLYDSIRLDADTARPDLHLYRILDVDPIRRTVRLDGSPSLSASPSTWEIRLRPTLVLVDSFGGRQNGNNASIDDRSAPNTLTLDDLPHPSKINPNFDTIYLPADANSTRPSKSYRILAMQSAAVTLRTPQQVPGKSEAWHVWAIRARGSGARTVQVKGNVIALQGLQSPETIVPGSDWIYLENDTARPSKTYSITGIQGTGLTLNGRPQLDSGGSAWRIQFVRIKGNNVEVTSDGKTVFIGHLPNPSPIIPGSDLISFGKVGQGNAYEITAVRPAMVTLDGAPVLSDLAAAWHIPAGISGTLPKPDYDLGPGGDRGYDHFDGVLFTVYENQIHDHLLWSSYSSRRRADSKGHVREHEDFSSIRGNRHYRFRSLRAGTDFINYAFLVHDLKLDNAIREARFYLDTLVTPDEAPPDVNPTTDKQKRGKQGIFIHDSTSIGPTSGVSSDGCLVSPEFYKLRDSLIHFYQHEYMEYNPTRIADTAVLKLYGKQRKQSQEMWQNTANSETSSADDILPAEDWDGKIIGTLWLIRPDERPLE